jgi:hypothetical protein
MAEHPQSVSGVLSLGAGAGGLAITASPGMVPKGGTPLAGGTQTAFSWRTLALAMLGALAGGLILNVMPCVFPIQPESHGPGAGQQPPCAGRRRGL